MIETGSPSRLDIFFNGLGQQLRVLHALSLRELHQRFGRDNIGYLWIIAEPMLLASVVTFIHSLVSHGEERTGMSPFTFMLTGYTIFVIFRNTFNRAEGALRSSETLLYHRMITPFDIMLSKSLVETFGCVSALALLQGAGIILGLSDFPARPLYLMSAILLFSWWAFSAALIIAAYTYNGHFLGRLVMPMSYFALPISGAFVTMSVLPSWARAYMSWNPMMSLFEMARYGQFVSASPNHIYTHYVVAVCVFSTYWGMLALRRLRKDIHVP